MRLFQQQLRPHSDLVELLRVFSLSAEFGHIPVRDE
jgi:hypothetical protein